MAVDWIARLLAMARGCSDAYTKAETDALLADKADLANGKIPAAQLPSYVDDTIEGYLYNGAWYEDAQHTAEVTGESGKIYVDLVTNRTYRWSGSAFVEISESLALGETSSTAYAGNKGKANADAIAAMKDGQGIDSFGDVEAALAGKANTSDLGAAAAKGFDESPTSGNTNSAVSSDGVYRAIAVADVSSMITARSGFTVAGHTKLFKQGKHIFGTIAVKKDSGYFGNDIACDLSSEITPAYQILTSGGFGNNSWDISAIGTVLLHDEYSYVNVIDASAGSYDYVHVQVDYFTS